MSSVPNLEKKKSIVLDKDTQDKSNNNINRLSIKNTTNNNINTSISQTREVNKDNNIITNKILYSYTESDINQNPLNIKKGEETDFNLNLNGEIKLNKDRQEKTVVCWNCQSLLLVKEGWEIVECSECNKLNRIAPFYNSINQTRNIDVGRSYGNLNIKGDVPFMYGIVVCPMCETENKFSKYDTSVNCYKCGYTIFLKNSPFNNGIRDISRSYDFSQRNYPNYGYINPPPYNPNVIQVRGIFPMPPIMPYYNNDYTLLKILELLKKRPKKTYFPYPMFPRYRYDDEPKQQIRYIPINEKKEPKIEDFKITIRKKPKYKSEFKTRNKAFEKVFYTKLK